MKQEELSASSRGILGKKVRALRRKGLTPANLYRPNTESIPLQVETPLLERLIARVGQNALITLRVDGVPRFIGVMIRNIQRNPLTDGVLHVSFFQVEMTQKVRAEVPLLFLGEAPAVKSRRWILIQNLTTLQVEALPSELPRNIEVDLHKLEELNRAILVRGLPIGDAFEVLNDPDQVIAHVEGIRIEVEEAKPVEAPPESEM